MGKTITGRDDSNSVFLEFVKFVICIMLSPITEYHSLGLSVNGLTNYIPFFNVGRYNMFKTV